MIENTPKLFIPGPTEVDERVRLVMAQRVIGHRTSEMTDLYGGIVEKLQKFFGTKHYALVFTSSGSGVMEGTIRNLAAKHVLHGACGAFSKRWYEMSLANDKEADLVWADWGKAVKPEMIAEAMEKKKYELLAQIHNETSTGVRNPTDEIAKIAHENDTLIAIDAVSSLGGDMIKIDNYDVVIASSQKALALPPGLAVAFVSEDAMERSRNMKNKGFYFDFVRMLARYEKNKQHPSTPAVSLLYAMDMQLDLMLKEGYQGRYERHLKMQKLVHNWVKKRGFEFFAEPGYESVTVTTIKNTHGISVKELNKELIKRGMMLSNGYGSNLKEKTFRIAHMGQLTPADIMALLDSVDEILESWGVY
ncbi:MAG: alanine--glyoxylate aminotransferase family protein [Euryarchaeota archaeon]|nr:alanine--glyoxylate aminotransferase family protein [Euryarchaeota archaeon]